MVSIVLPKRHSVKISKLTETETILFLPFLHVVYSSVHYTEPFLYSLQQMLSQKFTWVNFLVIVSLLLLELSHSKEGYRGTF